MNKRNTEQSNIKLQSDAFDYDSEDDLPMKDNH